MRTFEDVERRWTQLFDTSIGVDLRQAIRDDNGYDPCEEGLRSVCWRAFLLYGPLSKALWTKRLAESRSAYASLRDHFLKFIDNPNDLHSSADPLADDDTSPWSTLRQDEANREEIYQDVTRCMQDNFFFREPTTQRRLLDILFIYSKLNPDVGYRQGMHELLAPILWVIDQDVVNLAIVTDDAKSKEGADFMLVVLDKKYTEHDAFSLFCAVMQTAKSFYEMGENRDSAAIVAQSNRIHDELLAAVDPDLAHHLQVIGVLPQIYSIRWIRLLFGREFDFKDVLKIWDILFAETLTLDIVDMTCVAILLRVRWSLIEADYTTAITLLTRFKLPPSKESPRSLVKDASYLNKSRTPEAAAGLIQHYSGQRPNVNTSDAERPQSPSPSRPRQQPKRYTPVRSSPSPSPARFSASQKGLENLLADVSGTIQKRTEGWSVSKAVMGAVGEVRRNVNNFQATHSRETSIDNEARWADPEHQSLKDRLAMTDKRNKVLAKMLDTALTSLRNCGKTRSDNTTGSDDVFNMALAKIQFVSVYLADADIPIPEDRDDSKAEVESIKNTAPQNDQAQSRDRSPQPVVKKSTPRLIKPEGDLPAGAAASTTSSIKHQTRPSLSDSSFSFMLGENRHRSSFVSSASDPPEQRRGSDAKSGTRDLWADGKLKVKDRDKDKDDRKTAKRDDGFTMSSLR